MNEQHPFFEHIRAEHPNPDNFDEFIGACYRPLRKSIRVNTLKISIADFLLLANKRDWKLTNIPWCPEGFWIEGTESESSLNLGNSGEHLAGLFYIQEASSMLPPSVLLSGNMPTNLLDMAAAPGSKTTQLAALMNNNGSILANELSASRLKVLHANLQRCGVTNTSLSHLDGILLNRNLTAYFDAILLDAPCGGEGTFRKDPKALDNWSKDAMQTISSLQKQLIVSAWKMLKPGGRLVYSTCTLSRAENHDVIDSLQQLVGDEMKVVNLQGQFKGANEVATTEGYLHVWPEKFDCEGFFVACLEKNAIQEQSIQEQPDKLKSLSPFKTLPSKTLQLIEDYYQQQFGFDIASIDNLSERLKIRESKHEQQVWLFPNNGATLRDRLHLHRTGIRLCDLINSRKGLIIKTGYEFAISFGGSFRNNVVVLNATQAMAFLKGENITVETSSETASISQKGEVVLTQGGNPLGLAKILKNHNNDLKLKNNLPRHLLRTGADFID